MKTKYLILLLIVLFGCKKSEVAPSTPSIPVPPKSTYRQDTLTTFIIKIPKSGWTWNNVAKNYYSQPIYISSSYVSYSGSPEDDFNFDVMNGGWKTMNTTNPGNANDTLESTTGSWNMSLIPPQLGIIIIYLPKNTLNDTITIKEIIYGK